MLFSNSQAHYMPIMHITASARSFRLRLNFFPRKASGIFSFSINYTKNVDLDVGRVFRITLIFFLLCYSSNATFFLLLCHCNISIMLKIMLSFHRNNHKPTIETKAQSCHMSDMSPHAFIKLGSSPNVSLCQHYARMLLAPIMLKIMACI